MTEPTSRDTTTTTTTARYRAQTDPSTKTWPALWWKPVCSSVKCQCGKVR